MVTAVHELTSESEIDKLYASVVKFIKTNKEEAGNQDFLDMLQKLSQKIKSYAQLQGRHQFRILAKLVDFILTLEMDYGVSMECSKSSILLRLTFSTRRGYERYQKDLNNGRIGNLILKMFLYPPILDSFGLKADDIAISLNGRDLTLQTGMILV